MDYPTGTVSFLFTDIEGSTRLVRALGERYADVLGAHAHIIETATEDGSGIVVNIEGDAYFCVFRHAASAVGAAVDMQRHLAVTEWPEDGELRVRIGIHTGEGTTAGRDYVGMDVHRAARIADAGHGGQIVISAETLALAGRMLPEGVAVVDLGEHLLKDLPAPEHLYQISVSGLPPEFPALRSIDARPNNLPEQLTTFVGRSDELEAIRSRLETSRLITLVGPGGAGKTRLALESGARALDDMPDGVWLVELAALTDPHRVQQALAGALRLREQPGVPITTTITDHLAPKRALIILDNCEHLLDACGDLADGLLRSCPHVRIVATSRQPLGVPGEAVHQVPGLGVPPAGTPADEVSAFEAVQLFTERARDRKRDFKLDAAGETAVADISRRLDGIPLAIELAAARINVLGVDQISERLADRFQLLTGGSAADVTHHQTLRLTMDWSYDLLLRDEAVMLRCLSVFAAGFNLEAAEAVCSRPAVSVGDVLDLLQQLVDRSLVGVEDQAGQVRYRMLETVSDYARDKLTAAGEDETALSGHARFYLGEAERAEPDLQGSGDSASQVAALDRLEQDHQNLRAALAWLLDSEPDIGVQLAAALWRYWEVRGYLSEGSAWLAQALAVDRDVPLEVRARALDGAGRLAWRRGDFDEAEPSFRESLEVWRSTGNQAGEANALHGLARAAINLGDPAAAQSWGEQSLEIQQELDNSQGIATAVNTLGEIARFRGDLDQAHDRYAESLAIYEEIGDTAAAVTVKHNLAYTALARGDVDRAESEFLGALLTARDLRDQLGIFSTLAGLAGVATARGEVERAAQLFGAAEVVRKTGGYAGDRIDREQLGRNLAATRAALSEETFDLAWDAGQQLTQAAAIAFALGE